MNHHGQSLKFEKETKNDERICAKSERGVKEAPEDRDGMESTSKPREKITFTPLCQ